MNNTEVMNECLVEDIRRKKKMDSKRAELILLGLSIQNVENKLKKATHPHMRKHWQVALENYNAKYKAKLEELKYAEEILHLKQLA